MTQDTLAEAIRAHCQKTVIDWYANGDDYDAMKELHRLIEEYTEGLIEHLQTVLGVMMELMAEQFIRDIADGLEEGDTLAEKIELDWKPPEFSLNDPPEETSAAQDEAGSPPDEADTAAVAAADPAPTESVAARDIPATKLPPQREPGKQEAGPAGGGAGNGKAPPLKQNGAARPKSIAKCAAGQLRDRVEEALESGVPVTRLADKAGVSEPTVRNIMAGGKPREDTAAKVSAGLDAFGY